MTKMELLSEAALTVLGRMDADKRIAAAEAGMTGAAMAAAGASGGDAKRHDGAPAKKRGDRSRSSPPSPSRAAKKAAWKPPTVWASPMRGCNKLLADGTECGGDHMDGDHDKPGSVPKKAGATKVLRQDETTGAAIFGGLTDVVFNLEELPSREEAFAALATDTSGRTMAARAGSLAALDASPVQIFILDDARAPASARGIYSGDFIPQVLPMLRDLLDGSDADIVSMVQSAANLTEAPTIANAVCCAAQSRCQASSQATMHAPCFNPTPNRPNRPKAMLLQSQRRHQKFSGGRAPRSRTQPGISTRSRSEAQWVDRCELPMFALRCHQRQCIPHCIPLHLYW